MEDIALLKKVSFFSGLDRMELLQINKLAARSVFSEGQEVVKEGTACDSFYIIKKGSLKIEKEGRYISTLGTDEAVGEMSFLDKGLRSATAIALEETVLIKIPVDSLEELLENNKDIAGKIYKSIAGTLCRRLRETNNTAVLFGI